MAPLIVLVTLFALFCGLGYAHIPFAFGWWVSLRLALAGMFLLTASAHWGKRRSDLVRMVPPQFPRPELLVTITGIIEIAGAAGLLWRTTAHFAALGLFFFLLAIFPANVHAAHNKLSIGGRRVLALVPRALIQATFLAATIMVVLGK